MISQKELLNLPDLLNAHGAAIERTTVEQQQCQNSQLREILKRHEHVYRSHYDAMRSILQGSQAGQTNMGGQDFRQYSQHGGSYMGGGGFTGDFGGFEPLKPGITDKRISDRSLAIGCLEFCKHLALTCTWMATEAATPEIRHLLLDMTRDHAEMAFELFAFMSQQNWYAAPPAQQQFVSQVAQGFPQIAYPQ